MIEDVITQGLASGWSVQDGSELDRDLEMEADVVIVGTGAGGGLSAEVLTRAGLNVVLVEEGPLKHLPDFKMEERFAYPDLYQDSASRKTKDKAINILQGRCVGGGTTVNWTSSFATPDETLNHWGRVHEVEGFSPEDMAPWFEKVKARLNIHKWPVPPNPNNEALRRGAERLGWSFDFMHRNVKGCANLGYCGMGCPINAKQSMLVTTIPAALDGGARLYTRMRAVRLTHRAGRVTELVCQALDGRGVFTTGRTMRIKARAFVLAGGAIGSPALLMRSKAPDPHDLVGKRTFLHPVTASTALFAEPIRPFSGAPQSVFSDQFLWPEGVDGPMGYKLEVPPLHPILSSTVLDHLGEDHHRLMKDFAHMQAMLSLCRDGFHPESQGGRVVLRADGSPELDYPFTDYVRDGFRRSLLSMVELQFAAGATSVWPAHRQARSYSQWKAARAAVAELPMDPQMVRLFSAHVMGGCPMGREARHSVVTSEGMHHHLENLAVIDGSVFPTSIGTNPQVSIYGMAMKNATALAARLTAAG